MKLPTAHEALSEFLWPDISVVADCGTSVQNPPRLSRYSVGPTGGRSKGVASLPQWATKVLLGGPAGPYIVSGLWGMVSLSPA